MIEPATTPTKHGVAEQMRHGVPSDVSTQKKSG